MYTYKVRIFLKLTHGAGSCWIVLLQRVQRCLYYLFVRSLEVVMYRHVMCLLGRVPRGDTISSRKKPCLKFFYYLFFMLYMM